MSDEGPLRRAARWVGELLQGTLPGVVPLFVRAFGMLALAALTMLGAFHYGRLGHAELPGRRGWQGLVVLAMALFFRAVFELGERDRGLAITFVAAALFGSMAAAGVANDAATEPNVIGFGVVALVSVGVAAWPIATLVREERGGRRRLGQPS